MATVCSAHKFQQQLPKSINTHRKIGAARMGNEREKKERRALLKTAQKRDRTSNESDGRVLRYPSQLFAIKIKKKFIIKSN